MRHQVVVLIVFGIWGNLMVGAARVGAQVSVIDQSRTVVAFESVNMPQTDTAVPFAPFDDTIHLTGSFTGIQTAGNTVFFDALAWQSSTVDVTGQTLNMSASGLASFSIVGNASFPSSAGGRSNYSVTFQVASPSSYTIVEQTDHQTESAPFNDYEAYTEGARLQEGATDLIPYPLWNQPSAGPVTFTGMLDPGTYVFSGEAYAYDLIEQGSASYSADLRVESVPEPSGLVAMGLGLVGLLRRRS